MKRKPLWPSRQLLDFATSLARLMKIREVETQRDFAKKAEKKPSWISSVLSANENLTIETMADLVASLDGEVYIQVAPKESPIRWVPDVLDKAKTAPDLSLGWPRTRTFTVVLPGRWGRSEADSDLTAAPTKVGETHTLREV